MKKTIFFILVGFSIVSLACNFSTKPGGMKPNVADTPQTILNDSPTTQPQKPTAMKPISSPVPTEAIVEAPTDAPTEAVIVPSPLPQQPSNYTEAFDKDDKNWGDPLFVTSQAVGHDPFVKIKVASGVMQIAISDKETYLYRYFKNQMAGNQNIQVDYEMRGVIDSGIALTCKANPDMNSWFEARLNPSESKFSFYRYDSNLKAADKNPYVLLTSGIVPVKDFPPAKGNTFSFSCYDDRLILDINNGKKVITQEVDEKLDGSLMGIGVMSYDNLPATYDFKTVDLKQIQ